MSCKLVGVLIKKIFVVDSYRLIAVLTLLALTNTHNLDKHLNVSVLMNLGQDHMVQHIKFRLC